MPKKIDLFERFEQKIAFEPNTGCWLWTATLCDGYGQFGYQGRVHRAHRIAWMLYRGPIPAGMDLDHLCRVRCCVNPSHLEPVTRRVNILRGEGLAAQEARRTHCPKGHPYDAANTYRYRGGRTCRRCQNAGSVAVQRRRRARRREAAVA